MHESGDQWQGVFWVHAVSWTVERVWQGPSDRQRVICMVYKVDRCALHPVCSPAGGYLSHHRNSQPPASDRGRAYRLLSLILGSTALLADGTFGK